MGPAAQHPVEADRAEHAETEGHEEGQSMVAVPREDGQRGEELGERGVDGEESEDSEAAEGACERAAAPRAADETDDAKGEQPAGDIGAALLEVARLAEDRRDEAVARVTEQVGKQGQAQQPQGHLQARASSFVRFDGLRAAERLEERQDMHGGQTESQRRGAYRLAESAQTIALTARGDDARPYADGQPDHERGLQVSGGEG